ncbi:MAG TPA: DNA-processing protein DprA [Propionibacteriaceae bacterium]|jgi:DNA processing protein|nr:DNA-processing protein DprA [Propionibacteriaceae bacterium]
MITSDRRARLSLCCAVEGGDPAVAELVQNLGAEGAWAKIIEGVLGEPVAQRAAQIRVDVFERLAEAAAARFVVPGDDEWPGGLDDLRHTESIQRRGGEPFGLWLRGPGHLAHLMERSVAIVGSRAATAYGNGIAADLAADLVERGVTVLSGGAFGIDVAAHRGALAAGGPTVCVLANGVDVAYPPGHASIFETLAKDQLLVSELPPAAHPTRVRFLTRNRLIAAMSRGTVVVEAALRSGARNTAGWALACGRPLMAVPGPVYSRASTAPHLMIRNGQAVLVTSAAEVLELISDMGQATLPFAHGQARATDALTESQLAVFEAIPARRRATVGDIALAAGVSVPTCLGALTALESAGLVEGDERGWLVAVGAARK